MTFERAATLAIDPAPQDAVSCVSFAPDDNLLLVSTWAGSITLHDSVSGSLRVESKKHPAALLDAAWISQSTIASASLDGAVLVASITEAELKDWTSLGKHTAGASCVVTLSHDMLASGGWDKRLKIWSPAGERIADIDAGGKVYGATRCGEHGILFITSERRVRLIDVRKTQDFIHDKVPPKLSYQLRGISASEDGTQYVVGSTAGRVAVEWLNDRSESFSFKCHRLDGFAYPVNCIAHNRKYSSFATAGGDGHVSFWDGKARKRIAQYPRYPTSVSSINFDSESSRITIAVSYTFEDGEKDHPPDEVLIRKVDNSHIATKFEQENVGDDRTKQENGN